MEFSNPRSSGCKHDKPVALHRFGNATRSRNRWPNNRNEVYRQQAVGLGTHPASQVGGLASGYATAGDAAGDESAAAAGPPCCAATAASAPCCAAVADPSSPAPFVG